MTVTTENSKVVSVGDGVIVQFFFNFKLLEDDHMEVYIDNILQLVSTYTVNANADQENSPGGDVTFFAAPGDGLSVTLLRNVPLTQLVDYVPFDPFPAETHEAALDLATMAAQQLQEQIDRTNRSPPGSGEPPVLGEINTASNLSGEEGVFAQKVDDDLEFKSLNAGNDIALSSDANGITINSLADGEINDGANIGAGEGVFAQKNGLDLEFKVLVGGNNIDVTGDSTRITINTTDDVDITTDIPQTLQITEPLSKQFLINTLLNQANSLVQLDANAKVPSEFLSFDGLVFFGAFVPELLVGDADNPSTRFPTITFANGSWYAVVGTGFIDARAASDPTTPPSALPVDTGDGIVYLIQDATQPNATGWYWIEDLLASDLIIAENVIFDDSTTVIKGTDVQVWNQAIDAVVDALNTQTGANTAELATIETGAEVNQDNLEVKSQYEANPDTNEFDNAEKTKLGTVETNAAADQSDAEIKASYEANANTNEFDDTEKAKLLTVQTGAEANQSDAQIKTQYEANVNTNAFDDASVAALALSIPSDTSIVNSSNTITNIVSMTQAAYDALGAYQSTTLYVIVG